jgi:long-chain acyl-CoA synthetase
VRSGLDLLDRGRDTAPAVLDPDGERLHYGGLRSRVTAAAEALTYPAKALVAVDRPRTVTGLIGYLAALSAGHAVTMVEERRSDERWAEIVRTYRPELLVAEPGAALAALARQSGYRLRGGPLPIWECRPATRCAIHADLALLTRTSGSLGPPKTVRLSGQNLLGNATAIARALVLCPDDRAMTSLPLEFSFGLSIVNSTLVAGGSVALTTYSPSSRPFWEHLDHVAATSVGAVPVTYAFLRTRRWDPSAHPSLRLLQHAGGPLDDATREYHLQRMAAKGGEFVSMYGQTEATARISYLPSAQAHSHPGSVGIAVPGGRVRIERPDGGLAGDGETGEVVFAGPGVMMGYATSRADLSRGDEQGSTLRTGDRGCLRSGMLYVTGRLDRQVKVFGMRIDLDEIERDLSARGLTAVVEAVTGERLVVVAEPAVGLDDARGILGRRLGLPSAVLSVHQVSSLPYNGNGKVDRGAVRRLIAARGAGAA